MAFRLEEFKKTTRKSAGGAPATVYPHQIKDKKAVARLEVAIRLFDGSVGKRRKDLDARAMTDFFGDPRLARGMVACLGQFYKYETPSFKQIVGEDAAGRLRESRLTRPSDARAATYAHVNEHHGGFLTEAGRADCYTRLGEQFSLTAHQWDTLLHLDAEENQILTRPGAVPTPADIIALYNFHSLDTALKRATAIMLSGLSLNAGAATDIRALARALGVKAIISGETVTLSEEPTPLQHWLPGGQAATLAQLHPTPKREGEEVRPNDSCTSPSLPVSGGVARSAGVGSLFPRRAGRLGRCLLHLVQSYATRTTIGFADTILGTGKFRLTLAADTLRALGMPARQAEEKPSFKRRFEAAMALHKDLLKRRARGEGNGWRIKRLPDPVVTALGILLPDFRLTREGLAAYLLLDQLDQEPNGEWGAPVLSLPPGRKSLDSGAILARAEAATNSLFTLPRPVPAVPGDVLALCDRAAANGMVRAAEAQRTLHLRDESPLIEWVRQAADPRVRYIPGVGLCSQTLVAAIQGDPVRPA